jgi:hypothetical protein
MVESNVTQLFVGSFMCSHTVVCSDLAKKHCRLSKADLQMLDEFADADKDRSGTRESEGEIAQPTGANSLG